MSVSAFFRNSWNSLVEVKFDNPTYRADNTQTATGNAEKGATNDQHSWVDCAAQQDPTDELRYQDSEESSSTTD